MLLELKCIARHGVLLGLAQHEAVEVAIVAAVVALTVVVAQVVALIH